MPAGKQKRANIVLLLAAAMSVSGCLESTRSPDGGSGAGSEPAPNPSVNNSPSISGSPDLAVATGDAYSFTPNAQDADGDTLTFSIQNKPRWASFDSTTGQLSGQTFLGDTGLYGDIRISVSDGTSNASLATFAITVTEVALGSMTLNWTAPTENTNGSPLTDLAGYNIYYGQSPGSYSNQIRIDNSSINTYLVENLVPDTYYVVATSFNSLGIESTFSNEATQTVTTP